MAEAELIRIVWEIFNDFSDMRQFDFTVRLNHTSLFEAVLIYCGIGPEKFQEIFSINDNAQDGKSFKFSAQSYFENLGLSDQVIETLINLSNTENNALKIASFLKKITLRMGDAAILAKNALREIETVTAHIRALGVKVRLLLFFAA